MFRLLALAVVLGFGFPWTANAASLSPSKPSAIVTLGLSGGQGGCDTNQQEFDIRYLPDGSAAPFTIPAGQVLVVTGLDWYSPVNAFLTPTPVSYFVTLHPAPYPLPLLSAAGEVSSLGGGGGHAELAVGGAVIKPGTHVCGRGTDGAVYNVTVHGFLAKDR